MKLAFENLAHAVFLPPVVSLSPVAFAACGILAACGGFAVTRFWFFILGPDLHCRGGGVSTRVKGGAFPCSAFILDARGRAHNVKQAVADSPLPALFTRSLKL